MRENSLQIFNTGSIGCRISLAAILAVIAVVSGCTSYPPPSERSVILITLDTTRADRLGAYGSERVPTPNLDRIAEEGVLFESAISHVPLTLPSHASLLTSLLPSSHGVHHNGIYSLSPEVVSIAELARDNGMETAAFVAAYVLNSEFGTAQGFDTYDGVPVDRFKGGMDQIYRAERTADQMNERVFEWLDGEHGDRVFLWVHYYDPHDPYEPPETEGRTLHGEGYDREISYLDSCFGDLINRLERDGWLDRSILVVVGDHGESLGEHGQDKHGMFLYEADLRVPLMIRAPGLVPAGRTITGPAGLVDVAPTILEMLEMPPFERSDGRSLAGRIDGDEDGALGLVFGETWMPRLEYGWSELYMVRSDRHKFIQAPMPELYDLDDDPGELINLAGSDPERADEMSAWLGEWLEESTVVVEDASRALSAEEEARLRSLGYLGGDAFRDDEQPKEGEARLDPKDMIKLVSKVDGAHVKLMQKDPAGALEDLNEVLAANPFNHWARRLKINALIDLDRLDEAEEESRAGVSLAEMDAQATNVLKEVAMSDLAGLLRATGRFREAEELYRRILSSETGGDLAAVDLAKLLADTGRREEALELLGGVLEHDPNNGTALGVRVNALLGLGRKVEALETAQALSRTGAGDPEALVNAGDLLMQSGLPQDAAACYKTLIGRAGIEPKVGLPIKLGIALFESGKVDEAREIWFAAVKDWPDDPRPLFHMGLMALLQGNEEEAKLWYGRALNVDPTFLPPRTTMAEYLVSRGRLGEAKQELLEALRVSPGDPTVVEMLGKLSPAE